MKVSGLFLAVAILLGACGKSNHGSSTTTHTYFRDIIMNETVGGGGQPFQHALGYFSLTSDPTVQIMVASRGTEELYDAKGFRIAAISKTDGSVKWVRSYELDATYFIQLVTCAVMDKNENIWVGGHCFTGTQSASLFLAKLDKQGNMLWSKTFSNYMGLRAYALDVLNNGDIAFLTKNAATMAVHRLTSDGQPVWSVVANCNGPISIDNDYYVKPSYLLSPENHGLVETSDGSIFFASSGNPSANGYGGIDRLVRLDANGNLLFAKTYSVDNNTAVVRPVQLLTVGDNQLLMVDQAWGNPVLGPAQYFSLLSTDGNVSLSRMRNPGSSGDGGFNLNEVKVFNNNIYLSTCGGIHFNTYLLDLSLNVKSSIETVAAVDIHTDRGGVSLFDQGDQALYYIFNFGGNSGESNGFEVSRNGLDGKPCFTTYTTPPSALNLENRSVTVATDTSLAISKGDIPTFTPLNWNAPQVSVGSVDKVCGL